jgi:hypothetical protein
MFNVKPKMIFVATGATEAISKSFREYLSNIPGKHYIKALQRVAILNTGHTLRESANVNAQKN